MRGVKRWRCLWGWAHKDKEFRTWRTRKVTSFRRADLTATVEGAVACLSLITFSNKTRHFPSKSTWEVRLACKWTPWWVLGGVEIRSQSCKEKSFYPNYTDPLIWFLFHCPSLVYSCAFSWKLLSEAIPWRHAKNMSEFNYIAEQRVWKRMRPRRLPGSCFLPVKAIRLLSNSRIPQPSSPGPCLGNAASTVSPRSGDVSGLSGSGVQLGHARHQRSVLSRLVWGCTPTIKERKRSLLLLAFSGICSKTSFPLPPPPSCLIRTCLQARGMVFLKSYCEKQLFSRGVCSIVSTFPLLKNFFSLFLSPPGRSCHTPKFPVEAVLSLPQPDLGVLPFLDNSFPLVTR